MTNDEIVEKARLATYVDSLGLHIERVAELRDEMSEKINELLANVSDINVINNADEYKRVKETRKEINGLYKAVDGIRKEKVKDFTGEFTEKFKTALSCFDSVDDALKAKIDEYETEMQMGSAKRRKTLEEKKMNDALSDSNLCISFECPSFEVKLKLMQFALENGAKIL